MKDIKLTIDGKTIQLTEEQVESLNLKELKSPFRRVVGDYYYMINDHRETISRSRDADWGVDRDRYSSANYCTDKDIIQQQAYRELLNRLLWRFSMENGGDEIGWDNEDKNKYIIYYNHYTKEFNCHSYQCYHLMNTVGFTSEEIAKRAIEEIIKPFIAEHPDFVI